jgi:arginyl-tRNA--protein-N-Asp/Glu arginylyltransferase
MTMDYENKIVDLNKISEEARGILVEASGFEHIPYNERIYDKDYQELYQKFQKATHQQFLNMEGDEIGKSFDRFQVAAVRMRRKLKTLTYKNQDHDYDTKNGAELYADVKNKVWTELGL